MPSTTVGEQRARNLRAALFLRLPSTEPELNLLHRVFDSWSGLGLITVGVERRGMPRSLSHIAEEEWRATFQSHAMWAPEGLGCQATGLTRELRCGWCGARHRDEVGYSSSLLRVAPCPFIWPLM